MIQKTRGIVFRFTRYGETSIIVNIFTGMFGLQSYIVNGIRSKTNKGSKIALYQPLTLLDLVVYHKENAGILRIKEVKCLHPYQTIQNDIHKTTIAMFLNEVVNKAVKDQSHAEEICDFMIESFVTLDEISNPENFHLIFLLKLSRYLGFGAQTTDEVLGTWQLSKDEELVLKKLLESDYHDPITISYTSRKNLVEALLHHYSNHIDNFGEVKSIHILKDVLS
jgi:DNA repair protein RecO (recombination protein O)